MSAKLHRRTFALDEDTIARIERLAAFWKVTPSEILRRASSQVEPVSVPAKADPAALFRAYHATGGLDRARAESYLAELREDRNGGPVEASPG